MLECADCSTLPDAPPTGGLLHLAPPLARTGARLRGLLRRSGLRFAEPEPGIVSVTVPRDGLEKLALDLAGVLTSGEQLECRCLPARDGEPPTLGDLLNAQPLSRLVGRIRGEWVRQMLAEERLTIHFQPIVEARTPGRVFAHECLARGRERNGSLVTPTEALRAARAAGLLSHFDRIARLCAARAAAEHQLEGLLFMNVNPNAIHDPAACMASTMDALARAQIGPERVVFEVTETEDVADPDHLFGLLTFCRQNGFRVALDDLGAGYSSVRLLTRLKPDFVKLDRELVEGVDVDGFKARFVEKLIDVSRSLGIPIVAEGVETVREWQWIAARAVDYVQGFYVAAPAEPPRRAAAQGSARD